MKVCNVKNGIAELAYAGCLKAALMDGEPNEFVNVEDIEYAESEEIRNHWSYAISGW